MFETIFLLCSSTSDLIKSGCFYDCIYTSYLNLVALKFFMNQQKHPFNFTY